MYQLSEIEEASQRLKSIAIKTPLFESLELDKKVGGKIFVKPECIQITGSFKIRGAYNLMSQLSTKDASNGVVAFSSGNHAQGVALAGQILNIDTTIVIPEDAPSSKIENTIKLGGKVILYDRYKENREEIAKNIANDTGATLVPSYDHKDIIIGQGTVGLEIIEQAKSKNTSIDQVLICCGGGGLSAGSAVSIKAISPKTDIYLIEPENFNDTERSFVNKRRISNEIGKQSICDALLADTPGELTFKINNKLAAGVLTVSDEEVKEAMRFSFQHFKMVVEPGGAVALAAALSRKIEFSGKISVIVLSGGNVDSDLFNQIQAQV